MDIDKARALAGVLKEYDRVSELEMNTWCVETDLAKFWARELYGERPHPDDVDPAKQMREAVDEVIRSTLRSYVSSRLAEIREHLKTEYGVTVEDRSLKAA